MAILDWVHAGRLVLGAMVSLVAFSTMATADDTAERCANNKARLAELRQQIAAVPAWTARQSRQVGDDLFAITELAGQSDISAADYVKVAEMAVRYNFSQATCVTVSKEQCAIELLKRIEQSQKDNNELTRQRKALMDQAHNHEVNLIALGCDELRPDVEGRWLSMPVGDIVFKASFDGSLTIEGTMVDRAGGRLFGTLAGQILTGKWAVKEGDVRCKTPELGSYYWGRMKIVFDYDLKYFLGDIWTCSDPTPDIGAWKGMRPD